MDESMALTDHTGRQGHPFNENSSVETQPIIKDKIQPFSLTENLCPKDT